MTEITNKQAGHMTKTTTASKEMLRYPTPKIAETFTAPTFVDRSNIRALHSNTNNRKPPRLTHHSFALNL